MKGRNQTIPLVFHFTGTALPHYAKYSLKAAQSRWPGDVYLIHDRPILVDLWNVKVVNPADWYDSAPFQVWSAKTEMPFHFRDGFWHHAIERFFMLDQWSRFLGHERFLHCELDVAIFESERLLSVLNGLAPGVYYPRATRSHAGANWLFSSSPESFKKLASFMAENSGSAFEMNLLARFLDEFPADASAAPSHYTVEKMESGDSSAAELLQRWGGLVDVHPLGTWLLGHDPRNVKNGPVTNKTFYEGVGSPHIQKLEFRYSKAGRNLQIYGQSGKTWPLFAIHVHSKKMRTAYEPGLLRIFVFLLRLPFKVPIAFNGFGTWLLRQTRNLIDHVYMRVRS